MLSLANLTAIMPHLPPKRAGELLPFLAAAMTEFAIDTPARAAAFLAQLAHESGEFRFMEEIWGPTAAQQRYEPVTTLSQALGNTEAGDGKRFKGRGPIQLTGRANYQRFGRLLHVDLVGEPPSAASREVGFRIAGLYWSKRGLNELADAATVEAFTAITRRINGGTNGLAERRAFYEVARRELGVPEATTRGLSRRALPRSTRAPVFSRGADVIRRDRQPRRPGRTGHGKATKARRARRR